MTTYVLIDESKGVTGGDMFGMSSALERNAAHLAAAWSMVAPTVELWPKRKPLPTGYWPIYFVDETSDSPDSLAVHYVDMHRPTGRVYVGNTSGLNEGRNSVCEAASHELLEMMVNPRLNKWRDMPGRPGWRVALEVCDAVQTHYTIDIDGIGWKVANFVTRAWFEPDALGPDDGPHDHLGELTEPGEIGPEGYAILADVTGRIEFAGKRAGLNIRGARVLAAR